MPVRCGHPQYVTGLVDVVRNPIRALAWALLLFGHRNRPARLPESAGWWQSQIGLEPDEELVPGKLFNQIGLRPRRGVGRQLEERKMFELMDVG